MKQNVFLKSILRRPVRAVVLVVLMAAAAFAFTARAVEYFVVRDEIDRIEGFYRSIGLLSPDDPQNYSEDHNVALAAALVEASPHVAISDKRRFTQGVLADMYSSSSILRGNITTPELAGPHNMLTVEAYFFGSLQSVPQHTPGDYPIYSFRMRVDSLVAGHPSGLRERVVYDMFLSVLEGTPSPFEGIEVGSQHLMRAAPGVRGASVAWFIRPLRGNDGLHYLPDGLGRLHINPDWAEENLLYFVSADDEAALAAMLEEVEPKLDILNENLRTMLVTGTMDMSAMPAMQGRTGQGYLVRGRWIDHDDYLNANPVAVVHQRFATLNGLNIGDTFTLTLRDLPRPDWLDTQHIWGGRGFFNSLGEGFWNTSAQGWWVTITTDDYNWREHPTTEITVELVGTYSLHRRAHFDPTHNFETIEMFIPLSLMPPDFGWDSSELLLSGMYNFVLASPRLEAAFIEENSEALSELGFNLTFLETGVGNFWAAADPIRRNIAVNLGIFSVVSVLILSLAAFLYIRQNSRNFAILRALGMPAKKTVRQLAAPVLVSWLPAIVIGSIAAWFFAVSQAENTLSALAGFGAEGGARLPVWMLIVLTAGIILAALAALLTAGLALARKPVLELLQGSQTKREKPKAETSAPPPDFNLAALNISGIMNTPVKTSKKAAFKAAARHVFRHIVRSRLKTILAAGLALFFIISLGWLHDTINFTESEINRLFDTTVVTAEIARDPGDTRVHVAWAPMFNTITWPSINEIMISGFVESAYLEAGWAWTYLWPAAYDGSFPAEEWRAFSNPPEWQRHSDWILAANDFDGFVYRNTRQPIDDQLGTAGSDITFNFAPGFSENDFIFTNPDEPIPVIVRENLLELRGVALGDIAYLTYGEAPVRIIATFRDGLSRGVLRTGGMYSNTLIVMHLEALRYLRDGELGFMTAHFNLDTARNRVLHNLQAIADRTLGGNTPSPLVGRVPKMLIIHDEELRGVVEPMEQNLALLRLLYPIAIALSVVMATGISALLMLQNAKNAAILRILGTTKHRARLLLCAEQIVVTLAGISLGLIVLPLIGIDFAAAILLLSGLYLSSAIIGGIIGAVVISGRPPLELLQVRE